MFLPLADSVNDWWHAPTQALRAEKRLSFTMIQDEAEDCKVFGEWGGLRSTDFSRSHAWPTEVGAPAKPAPTPLRIGLGSSGVSAAKGKPRKPFAGKSGFFTVGEGAFGPDSPAPVALGYHPWQPCAPVTLSSVEGGAGC